VLPKGLLRRASLRVIEWLFGDEEVPPPRPGGFQAFRLDEELVEEVEAEPRCRPDGAGAFPSAGRVGDVEDLEKLGTGNESTILSVKRCYIVEIGRCCVW
jgi:hypothetical protein